MFIDIDECNDDSHECDFNANSTNTNGSYNCICKEGYIINGQSCQCRIEQRYVMSRTSITSFIICIHYSCPQASTSAALEAMYVT